MKQLRLCCFYKHDCTHTSLEPTTFLNLPEHVRHRIYVDADFPTGELVRLEVRDDSKFCLKEEEEAYDLPATEDFHFQPVYGLSYLKYFGGYDGFETYLTLRLVSRGVKADLIKCLCVHNGILLDRENITRRSLTVLKASLFRLSDSFTHLTIILDEPPARKKFFVRHDLKNYVWAVNSTSSKFQAFLPYWHELIDLLTRSPSSTKIELKLLCNAKDEAEAQIILNPLERLRVASCSIHLNTKRIPTLLALARSTVLQVTGKDTSEPAVFRFLDLPPELRQHVLSFTDLVAPWGEIMWCSRFTLYDWYQRFVCQSPCRLEDVCSNGHSVFPLCRCWRIPTPIFLVCRAMLPDARAVFYSRNRFIVSAARADGKPPTYRTERFEASVFLGQIVPRNCLKYLRDVEILFPGSTYNYLGIDQAILDDWENTIRLVAPHLTKLTLTLYLGGENHICATGLPINNLGADLKALFHVWEQIVRPLRHLRRCFNTLLVECFWSFQDYHTQWNQSLTEWFQKHERYLEGLVMGDGYDSVERGKKERHLSRWVTEMADLVGPTYVES